MLGNLKRLNSFRPSSLRICPRPAEMVGKAEEAIANARAMKDKEARAELLVIAEGYMRLAGLPAPKGSQDYRLRRDTANGRGTVLGAMYCVLA